MKNLKNLNAIPHNNTSIILDSLFYTKKMIKKNQILLETLVIIWNNIQKKFSGYLFKKEISNLPLIFQISYNSKTLNKFITSRYMDIDCSFFDMYNLFEKNYTLIVPIISIVENILIKIVSLWKIIYKTIKDLSKNSAIFTRIFLRFNFYMQQKNNLGKIFRHNRTSKILLYNLIFDFI
jgi:hypothetical protein